MHLSNPTGGIAARADERVVPTAARIKRICGELSNLNLSNSPIASPRLVLLAWLMTGGSVATFVSGVLLYAPVLLGSVPGALQQERAQFSLALFVATGLTIVGAGIVSYRNGRRIDVVASICLVLVYLGIAGYLHGEAAETRKADRLMTVKSEIIGGRRVVYVGGELGPTLRWRLDAAIGNSKDVTLCLASHGGDALATAKAADILTGRNVTAIVGKCWSSCAYLVAAADQRMWVGPNAETGSVMVHDVGASGPKGGYTRWRVNSILSDVGATQSFKDALHKIGNGPVCALSEARMNDVGLGGRAIDAVEYAALCGKVGDHVAHNNWGVTRCTEEAVSFRPGKLGVVGVAGLSQ